MSRVLVVHDDEWMRNTLAYQIGRSPAERYHVSIAASKADALNRLPEGYDVVVTDLSLLQPAGADTEGLDVLREARTLKCPPSVIVLTAFGGIESGVTAMELGAFDYIEEGWPGVSAVDLVVKKVELASACSRMHAQ